VKFLLALILMLMVPISVNAMDQYYKSGVTWGQQITLRQNISVQSISPLSSHDLYVMNKTYKLTKQLFFSYWGLQQDQCCFGHLKIKIVRNHFDLSNYKYFPDELEYADPPGEGGKIIFGRYFRLANTLYVVRPNEIKYYWKRDFAHEILHYLFDECNMKFYNDDAEHQKIYEFFRKHNKKYN